MSYFGSIYADQELSHRAKTVYMYLKDRSNACLLYTSPSPRDRG